MDPAPQTVKRRLLLVLICAIALPGLLLSYASLTAVRADRFVLQKLREERLAGAAREAIARIEEEARERAREALAEIDPDLLGERLMELTRQRERVGGGPSPEGEDLPREPLAAAAKLGAIEAFVEIARERQPLIREAIAIDAAGRLVLPRAIPSSAPAERPRQDRVFLESPGDGGAIETPEGRLRRTFEALEARRAASRRLADARTREIDGKDPEGARVVYYELAANAADPELAAQARLDLARCEARMGEIEGGLADLEVLARVGPDLRTEDGVSVAATARLRSGELRLAAGRRAEAATRLLDLFEDVLNDRLGLTAEDTRFFAEHTRAALRGPELRTRCPPGVAERLARLEKLARRREEQRAYAAELEGRILQDLVSAARATPPSEEVSHFATIGGAPRLFAFRVLGPPPPAAGPRGEARAVIVGIEVDLARLVGGVAAPWLRRIAGERDAALELRDRKGGALAAAGELAPGEAVATAEFEELLPFWRVRAGPTPAASDVRLARFRLFVQIGLVLVSLVTLLLGGWWAIRAVRTSLELARLKSDFVSNVSHELRTPLTSIRMFAEMLRTGRARTPEKRDEYLETIMRESERLQKLIDDILDFARHEAGRHEYRFEAGDAGDAAAEALAAVGAQLVEAGFKLDLDVKRPLPPVRIDRKALGAALENLLVNARKYAGERREVALRARAEAGGVAIEVEDKGVGIAEAELGRVFEKFFRGEEALLLGVSGSGLGLALVKRVVEDHGGKIAVRSKKGEGTAFTVWLPASGGAALKTDR